VGQEAAGLDVGDGDPGGAQVLRQLVGEQAEQVRLVARG
jgi:hypothetical protein